jgi:hypothetical protein
VYIFICITIHIYIYIYVYTHISIYMYMYTHAYIYIYICTHLRNDHWKNDDCAQAAASESFGIKVWIARVVGVGLQTSHANNEWIDLVGC